MFRMVTDPLLQYCQARIEADNILDDLIHI